MKRDKTTHPNQKSTLQPQTKLIFWSQKISEQISNASLSSCLLLAFPFREASPAGFIISTVHTSLFCHNKQVLCSFNFKSRCSSRFQLEKVSSGKSVFWENWEGKDILVVNYGWFVPDCFSPGFFPSNVTGCLESSVSSVYTCRELMGPLGPPQWKEVVSTGMWG